MGIPSAASRRSQSCVARFIVSTRRCSKEAAEYDRDGDETASFAETGLGELDPWESDDSDAWCDSDRYTKALEGLPDATIQQSCMWDNSWDNTMAFSNAYAMTDYWNSSYMDPLGSPLNAPPPPAYAAPDSFEETLAEMTLPAPPAFLPMQEEPCPAFDDNLPSAGSRNHNSVAVDGQPACQPCAWFYKTSGCMNGASCHFCHLCPKDELRNRKKNKVARLRAQDVEQK